MPNLTTLFYNLTITNKTKHYIETGTYLGDGIKSTMNNYENVHSIELSEKWYHHNLEQFKENNNVKMYLGDSKLILPELLNDIQEPVTIYLDAHYSGGTTEFGAEETPLLFELEILKNRTYNDIIIINDCRLLGKQGKCGSPDQYGDNCETCGTTYQATELKNPRSVISGTTPIEKDSEHYFFQL